MIIPEKAHLRWACRRGMLELDLILIPFFDQHFDTLSPESQAAFEELLTHPDPDLFQWLMGYGAPAEAVLADMVKTIRQRHL